MPASGVSRAAENKRIRQEALRDQLSNQGHLQKVIDNIEVIEDLDGKIKKENSELDAQKLQRLKTATDARLKLINKYLPDLKATEHSGQIDSEVIRKHRVSFSRD